VNVGRVTVWSEGERQMLPEGTCLAGRFVIDGAPLGAGASGVVYPATDRATGRAVAAKVLHANDDESLARLQDEAAIAGRLRHPNVVEVVGLWSDRGDEAGPGAPRRWFLVSDRVRGMSLDEVGPVPPEAVVALGLELVDGLQAAEKLGLVHGDVRPGNVLVGPSGAALFDFGVGGGATQLRPGETAPERLDGGPPSPAGDVYGLGVVMYRSLCGGLPFEGDTPWAVMGAQRTVPEVAGPRGLSALIRRMLHPDPVERPDLQMVRSALLRLRTRPDRRLRMPRPLPPIRPGRPWVVHGIDPVTGGPALVRAGLSKRQARSLLARLRAEGWQVRGVREAFAWRDLLWIAAFTILGAVVLPVVGAFPAAWFATRWRAEGIRPRVARALPAVQAHVPPRVMSSGSETAVVVGLLLLATAVSLLWWPPAALVPAALVVALMASSVRPPQASPEVIARQGNVQAALARLRAMLESSEAPTPASPTESDLALGLAGEVDALESEWRGGLDAERVLIRVDDLVARVSQPVWPGGAQLADARATSSRDAAAAAALDALRRVREP
jgi:eukaryotic-like serine/threonine-protein kinase